MFRAVTLALLLLAGLILTQTAAAQVGPESSLQLADCRISAGPGSPGIAARCGTFVRPLDPDNESLGTIDLKVAVV